MEPALAEESALAATEPVGLEPAEPVACPAAPVALLAPAAMELAEALVRLPARAATELAEALVRPPARAAWVATPVREALAERLLARIHVRLARPRAPGFAALRAFPSFAPLRRLALAPRWLTRPPA